MDKTSHLKALSNVLFVLQTLDVEARRRVIDTVLTFFADDARRVSGPNAWEAVELSSISRGGETAVPFSSKLDISPKEFLLQKSPKTDVERVACLGFYLTHYRSLPSFKTSDLTTLNTEAAQPRFSNAAKVTSNATQYGYLAPAAKGTRQMSAQGEQFVIALPDREAAKKAMSNRPRRNRGKGRAVKIPAKNSIEVAASRGKTSKSNVLSRG